MPQPVIGLCTPVADQLHYQTFASIMGAMGSIPRPFHWLGRTDAPVEAARNLLVTGMLNDHPDITHLLWIDDDMTFDPDAIPRLLARDLPIVGGLCHNRRHPYMPILMRRAPGNGIGYGFLYDYDDEVAATGLCEVDATGGAFILVKREVYEKVQAALDAKQGKLTNGTTVTDGTPIACTLGVEGAYTQAGGGEDVSFCERAKAAGYRIFVDTTVKIGHMGEVKVDDDFARRNRDAYAAPWRRAKPDAEQPADDVRQTGLRINGFEMDDEGRRHRARYAWAGRKLGRLIKVGTVLDYGCGVGYGCKIMNRVAAEVGAGIAFAGFDVDAAAIEFGQKWWWAQITNSPLALDVGPYEAITSFEVLEHIDAHPGETLRMLLSHAPIVVGSVPYKEPAGFNPHHVHSMLDEALLDGIAHEVFGETWDGQIGPLDPDRSVNPIMLFVVRR